MYDRKRLLRVAVRLYQVIRTNQVNGPYNDLYGCLTLLQNHWKDVDRELRQMVRAVDRHWYAAVRTVVSESRFSRDDFTARLRDLSVAADAVAYPKISHCTVTSLLDDLEELTHEFPLLFWNHDEIWVQTKPVTLEGTYLGPFEIRLPITSLGTTDGNSADFRVVALDPHPSSRREDVTHPHVESGSLCTGDATNSIAAALEQGRIGDFFQIVSNVLHTYNEESPYVKLENWGEAGVNCADCGYETNPEDTYYCEGCQREYCMECSYGCEQCSENVCRGCSTRCPACDMRYCNGCMASCAQCEKDVCKGCLTEDGLCESCEEELAQKGTTEDEDTNSTNQPQGAAAVPALSAGITQDSDATAAQAVVLPQCLDQAQLAGPCGGD